MYTDFDKLPDTARVWVYQTNRSLTDEEVKKTQELLQSALTTWAAHGQPLLASAQVVNNRFVVVGVDEGYNLPSGCSIDASVRTLQGIGHQMSDNGEPIDYFDRSAAILKDDGSVVTFTLPTLKTAVAEGNITPSSIVLNTLVKTKATFLTDWHIQASQSWLKRYFKNMIV